jgi:hypothetical protein
MTRTTCLLVGIVIGNVSGVAWLLLAPWWMVEPVVRLAGRVG